MLAKKGIKAQRLFWNLVNRKPKKKKTFEALITGVGLTSNQDQMNSTIETFFERIFNTSFNPSDIRREEVGHTQDWITGGNFLTGSIRRHDETNLVRRVKSKYIRVGCK